MFDELHLPNKLTAFIICLYCFAVLFNDISIALTDIQCENQGDCNDGNSTINCGICINNDYSRVGKCIFPFPLQYGYGNKCPNVEFCEKNCSNHGECDRRPMKGYVDVNVTMAATCNCSIGFYGRICENSAPKDMSGMLFDGSELSINVQMVVLQNPFETKVWIIYLRCDKHTKNFTSVVKTETDGGGFNNLYYRKETTCGPYARRVESSSRFPYKPYEHDSKILRLGNEVLGYLSSLRVEVGINEMVYSRYHLPVFVSYQGVNLVCVPVVKLYGCGSSEKYENIYFQSSQIKISSNVFYIADGGRVDTSRKTPNCEENAKYHWTIWDGYNETNNPFLEYYEVKDLPLKPYRPSFKFKKYKVLLQVTSMQETKISQNFAYCYFRIKALPLVAVIDGGSERTVIKQYGLTLSTSRSGDPNMPPDKQGHMKASWSCVDVSKPEKNEICNPHLILPVSNSYTVPSELLRYGAVYRITLLVWTNYYDSCTDCDSILAAIDYAMIHIANKTDEGEGYIYIQCLLNCEKKVIHDQQLYLRVRSSVGSTIHDYEWTYFEKGQTTEKDTKNLTVEWYKLPSFMFLTKENAFSSGKSYVVVVRVVNKPTLAAAKYAFETLKVEFNGNCSITPSSGIKGISLFEVQCQNFNSDPIYEFYDKTIEEVQEDLIFNGRMLGTSQRSQQGELKDFRVTRGQIVVYIIHESGIYSKIQFTVELLPYNITGDVLGQIFENMTELLQHGESAKMLEYISAVSDIIPVEMDKTNILTKFLHFITLVPTEKLADIKLTTSTMTNVLLNLNKPVQLAIDPRLMRDTLHIVRNQTYSLGRIVGEGTELHGMSPQEIRLVSTHQLNCLHAAFMSKDPRTVGITEFDYDLKTLDDLMDGSRFVEDAIYLIKNILTFLQRPGQPPTNISATGNSYTLWVVENDAEYNLTNYLSTYEKIPIIVSNELVKEFGTDLRKHDEELAVRVATLHENIFWWSKSDIKSNLLSVSLVKHSKSKHLGGVKFVKSLVTMQISLNSGINSTLVKGTVRPFNDSTECTLENDLIIEIHRLDPQPQSLITLEFLFPQTNGSLLVLVVRNHRPDCFMMKKAMTINETSPTYSLAYNDQEPTFYFVGITPKSNVSVTFTYELNTTVCQYWAEGHWSSKGCKISYTSKNPKMHCICDHFSIFGAAFPVPPQEIDLFSDISLFLTVLENPLVVSFVSIVLIIYLLCCLWAWLKDKKDKSMKNVIILDDNFPEDSFSYLIAVYTSSRFNAGTTAHVGIKIYGSLARSRPHILSSKERKVLKRNYDDWFLLYCSEPLGDLLSIHLWHDNSGSSPDWFCDKVLVYDLYNNTEVVFVVEQWIALRLTYYPEAMIRRASVSEVKSVKRMFLDNCVLGLRENHTLLCIMMRHPRSEVSRLQRINVLMCCLMTAMLCSIMFYSPQVDDNEYSVQLRDFYISVQSLVISLIATVLVLFAFKRSYEYTYSKIGSSVIYRPSDYKEIEVNTKKDKSVYSNFVRFVSKTMKGNPLVPAQLENSKPVVVVRKKWRILAWILCISVIITCSFFIMLYGLKLGLVKSKIWLSSVLFTLSEDFFVSTPARIIFFSVILSIAYQKMCDVDSHRVSKKDILTIKPQATEGQMEKLLIKRRHEMYGPLRSDFRNQMIRKKELWNNWWTVIDFTVALCFIFVVSIVVRKLWSSQYYDNSSVKKFMTEESKESVSFFAFKNTSQVNRFLKDSVLRSLYITFWYNNVPITEKDIVREYWAQDFTHTMVGHQRYRQIRVMPVTCKSTFINTTRQCIPHYNSATEDMGDYGSRWKPAQWHDVKQSNSAWKYTDMYRSRFSTLYRLSGKSGVVFHNGGYLTDLGPTKVMATEEAEVLSQGWQDQLTRTVFVELTLYNINVDLFSQVTMTVEYLISGTIQLKAQVVSVESKMKLSFWNALFCAFIVYYVIRSGYLINRQGLMEYLSASSRNRSRLLIVLLGALSIALAAIHYFSSTATYNSFINRGYGDTYFDFDSFVYHFIQLQVTMSFLLSVAIVRTIFIFRGGRTLLNYFYTITISLRWIFWLTVVILVFIFVQVPLIILLNIFSFYNIEEIVLNLKFTRYFKSESTELKYLKVFFYVKCVVINILLCCYVLIFMHYFKVARIYKRKRSDNFNLISFVLDHMKITKRTK